MRDVKIGEFHKLSIVDLMQLQSQHISEANMLEHFDPVKSKIHKKLAELCRQEIKKR